MNVVSEQSFATKINIIKLNEPLLEFLIEEIEYSEIKKIKSFSFPETFSKDFNVFSNYYEMLITNKCINFMDNWLNEHESVVSEINEISSNITELMIPEKIYKIPHEIDCLKKLEYLYLSECDISEIDNICNLTNLKFLYLSCNKISIVPNDICNLTIPEKIYKIPHEIYCLKKLEYLYLSECDISEIDQVCNLTNLKFLYLSCNKISIIPNDICNLTNLEILNLNKNKISDLSSSSIGKLIKLEYLMLCENQIKQIPNEIGNLTNLIYLNVSDNNIEILPATLGNLINLTDLYLSCNKLTSLPATLENLTKLRWLDLGDDDEQSISGNYNEIKYSSIPKKLRDRECKRLLTIKNIEVYE